MTIQQYEPQANVVTTDDEPGHELVSWARALSSAHQIAKALCTTAFVPKHFVNKPDEAAAALMLGNELGLSPVSSLKSIFVISGTPGLYARAMVAITMSAGHEVWTEKSTDDEVVVCGRRKGAEHVERVSWTTARARKAKYTSNAKYESDPQSMLYARAAADVCRRIAPDALAGLNVAVEEMELEAEAAKPARKVSRKKADPAPALPAPEPEVEPETVEESPLLNTSGKLAKAMYAAINEAGITDAERLPYISRVIGRDIGSSKEMTDADAHRVLDELAKWEPQGEEPEVEA